MYNKIGVIMFQKDPKRDYYFLTLSDRSHTLSADYGCNQRNLSVIFR